MRVTKKEGTSYLLRCAALLQNHVLVHDDLAAGVRLTGLVVFGTFFWGGMGKLWNKRDG